MAEGNEKISVATKAGLALAAVTIVVSIANGIPAFLALKGKEAYVVYEINNSNMLYPPSSNREAIHALLNEKRIPDAFGSMLLSNRGDVAAKEIAITVAVPGTIVAESTEPSQESKPPWVTIEKDFDVAKDKSRIRYTLRDVGLKRDFKISVSYISESGGDINWDVFYDGVPAIRSNSIATVPENARSISFRPTLEILAIGLGVSLLVFIGIRLRGRFWQLLFLKVRFSHGGVSLVSVDSGKWREYRNHLLIELLKRSNVSITSVSEGSAKAQSPEEFWDSLVEIEGRKYALDVHSSDQRYFALASQRIDFAVRMSVMARRTPDLFAVAVVNDQNCWAGGDPGEFVKLMSELNGSRIRFLFLWGAPEQVVGELEAAIKPPKVTTELIES